MKSIFQNLRNVQNRTEGGDGSPIKVCRKMVLRYHLMQRGDMLYFVCVVKWSNAIIFGCTVSNG